MGKSEVFLSTLVLEIDSEEEVDHASRVSAGERPKRVFSTVAFCDSRQVCFVEDVVEVCLEANGRFVQDAKSLERRAKDLLLL
jgi:hypothetical protein